MSNKINRIGEINYNNFESKMIIVEYRNCDDIDVYFPKYNWTFKNTRYYLFKKGNIKCPYEPRVFGVGYLGEGKYKAKENGKNTKYYSTWQHMLKRCYNEQYKKEHETYKECKVCNEWNNLQNFGDWFTDNYYEIENEKMCLDKDILNKKNKIYSPNTCIFVPHNINVLFTKSDKSRGNYPIGVTYNNQHDKFHAQCSIYNYKTNKRENKNLGYYETPEEAFQSYKQFKEQYIKQVADYYKDLIPAKLYNALYEYKIEITD